MNNNFYRADIDGLRALAVLFVVGYHAAPGRITSGFIGVDIFFVISGFLITKIILTDIKNKNFSFINFYVRRIKRIFPSLITILLSLFLIGYIVLTDSELIHLCKHIFSGSLFISNFFLFNEGGYFDSSANSKLLLHLWSLSIEEQFYIIWPVILFFAFKFKINYYLLFSIIIFLSFFYNIYNINDSLLIFYSPLSRFWELLIGSILSLIIINRLNNYNLILLNFINLIGFFLIACGFFLIDSDKNFPGWYALLPCLGTSMVIISGQKAFINKYILSNRYIVWIGLISYPLYLWHWPLLTLARILEGEEISQLLRVLIVLFSIFLSWLTYRYIENPIRYGQNNLKYLLIVFLLTLFIGVTGYLFKSFNNRSFAPEILNSGNVGHDKFFDYISDNYYPCKPDDIYKKSSSYKNFKRCFQSKNTNKIDLAIIGDSHAEHLFPGIAEAFNNLNVVFYGQVGEPFVSNNNFDDINKFILSNKNLKNIIFAANWRKLLNKNNIDDFYTNIRETSDMYVSNEKKVFILNDVPNFSFHPSKCKYLNRIIFQNKCSEDQSEEDKYYLKKFNDFKDDIKIKFHFINTYELLCNDLKCSMSKNKILFYRDDNHLNINGSQYLGKKMQYDIQNK